MLERDGRTRHRTGDGHADIMLRRSGEKVLVDVLDRTGDVRVLSMV